MIPKSAQRSLDLLRHAQTFHEPTRAFYFVRAACRRGQGNTAAADEDWKQFKAAAARTAWDYFLPGHTAGWAGDLDDAIRSYRAALDLQPNHYNSLFFLAMRLATDKINRRQEAIAYFTGCIALRPHYYMAHRNRGCCYFRLGQLDDAIADFRQVLRLSPADAGDHGNLGVGLMGQGKTDEAIACFKEALRLQPDDALLHLNLGAALEDKGLLDEAIAANREALRLRPNYGCAYNNLGLALNEQGKLDEAIACHREAVRLGPADDADHHISLGVDLAMKGRPDEATACYNEALRLQPNSVETHIDLAWVLATHRDPKVRDPERAVELARKATELLPEAGKTWGTLGVARYRVGEWDSAIAALEKSESLAPNERPARRGFFLAMTHWRLRHAAEARTWYDRAVAWMEKDQPQNEELLRFRAEAETLMGLGELPADVFARP